MPKPQKHYINELETELENVRTQLAASNATLTELRDIVRTVCLEALDADDARQVLLSFASRASTASELLNLTRALAALNH